MHYKGIERYSEQELLDIYKTLNAEMRNDAEILAECIKKGVTTIVLTPAEPFTYDELKEIHKNIQLFFKSA